MNAKEAYDAGRLEEAISAQTAEVRSRPTDIDARGFLCELLCFAGELERADKQLETMGHQTPESMLGVSMFRQLLRGEMTRREFYADGRVPEFLNQPPEHIRQMLAASVSLREGKLDEAADLLRQAEEARPAVAGSCDGSEFDDLRDLCDLNSGFFEVITSNGKYYWVPTEDVELVEFRAPERPRDLIWRRAHMIVADGPDGEVFLPAIYGIRDNGPDDSLRLGRSTDWIERTAGLVEGAGQRTFLIGDADHPIMELGALEFSRSDG